MTQLSPSQQSVYDGLSSGLEVGNVLICWGKAGIGKTTILQELHRAHGGAFLTMHDFMQAMQNQNPAALEETFTQVVQAALAANEIVMIDDLHLLYKVMCDCGFTTYPRKGLIDAPLTTLAMLAANEGKKLIAGCNDGGPAPLGQRGYAWGLKKIQGRGLRVFWNGIAGRTRRGKYRFRQSTPLRPEPERPPTQKRLPMDAARTAAHNRRISGIPTLAEYDQQRRSLGSTGRESARPQRDRRCD